MVTSGTGASTTEVPKPERREGRDARAYLLVALGGVVGALCRHGVTVAVGGSLGHAAWGTFVANISGAFLLGFIMTLSVRGVPLPLDARRFVAVGVLGSYTTFSTLSYETWQLIEGGNLVGATANALGSLAAGLLAVVAGVALAKNL